MEMVPEATAGASNVADDLALLDARAHRGGEPRLVRVARGERARVLDAGEVAVPAGGRLALDEDDLAGGRCPDRGTRGNADVDARVAGLPRARLAERGGDRTVDGPDEAAGAGADRAGGGRAAGEPGETRLHLGL